MLFVNGLGMTPVQLHLVSGLIVFLLAFVLIRRPWVAFCVVGAVQGLNELVDAIEQNATGGGVDIPGALSDSAWTMSVALLMAVGIDVLKREMRFAGRSTRTDLRRDR